jgi:SAM-dependent methyltransferase
MEPVPASERWRSMVEAERAQSARIRDRAAGGPAQRWSQGRAEAFRADPHREGDHDVELIRSFVGADQTLLDVGAGGGRIALPVALRCQQVTAVEAAPPMAAILKEEAAKAEISNVTLIEGRWQDVEAPKADVVLCWNVLNYVEDIGAFMTKVDAHARERVLVVLHEVSPMAQVYPFWSRVHGHEPARSPGLAELLAVLWELDIHPDLQMLPPRPRTVRSREAARDQMRGRLGVAPDSPEDARLEAALDELLVEANGSLSVRGASMVREGLVTWRPAGA